MDIEPLIETKTNNYPPIHPGDLIKVVIRVKEGEKERLQPFQGVVIGVRKGRVNGNFTVRHVAYGVGVERTFFFLSPLLEKIEVLQEGEVRRAKLYYLRGLSSKASRAKIKKRRRFTVQKPEDTAQVDSEVEEA
jgi:large subunit ribosomal protein L19